LILNVALALAFLASLKPFVTGLAVHEWLGLAIGAAIGAHALLHRRWITGITRRLARPLPARTRLCYALNAALLLSFAFLIGSGLWISQSVLPLLCLRTLPSLALATAHRLSAWVTLGLLAAKLALHWRWFAQALAPRPRASALATTCPQRLSRRRLLLWGGSAACALALLGWFRYSAAPEGEPSGEDEAARGTRPADPTVTATSIAAPDPTDAGLASTAPATPGPTMTPTALTLPAATATPAPTLVPTAQPVVRTRCPYGLVNDPYPGRCRRYVDQDDTGYCDLSESA
jgi:hypothetical protein